MPYLTIRTRPGYGDHLVGIWRTLAKAQEEAALDPNATALEDEVLDADIPFEVDPGGNWYVRDAPAVGRVNASVEIQYGTSGKGFRVEFALGALGTAGNDWTITTGGTAVTFNDTDKTIELPEPAGLASAYLTLLETLSGSYQLSASYLDGTTAADHLSVLGSQTWRTNDAIASTPIFTGGSEALAARKAVVEGHLPLYTPRAGAALALDNGIQAFQEFVDFHAHGVADSAVAKVHAYLYQKRRALRMVYANDVTINGNAITLTDPQFIAWATFCRLGPSDTSAVDAVGQYNPEGLFEIFERADDPTVLTPTGPVTWVGLDVTQWTGGFPNRLTVAQIAPVLGTPPSEYLDIDNEDWLRE